MVSIPVPDPDFGGGRFGGSRIRRILVVDDERHIVRLIQVNLERHGYQVTTASGGREALAKAEIESPDLIVLDAMMPDMNGVEVLQNLKRNPRTHGIPVIVLTARAQEAEVFRGWREVVECFLSKPFDPADLMDILRQGFPLRNRPDQTRAERTLLRAADDPGDDGSTLLRPAKGDGSAGPQDLLRPTEPEQADSNAKTDDDP